MTKVHVYQLGLRRADNEKQKFIIESDLVYTEEKLTQTELLAISEKHKCDIKATYLGILEQPKKETVIEIEYHTKDMIQLKLDLWNQPQEEKEQVNG